MARVRYTVRHDSVRPAAEVERLLRFVLEEQAAVNALGGCTVAVRVRDSRRGYGYGGRAMGHWATPVWAGRAQYAVTLALPPDGWPGYGQAQVCWHSTEAKRLAGRHGTAAARALFAGRKRLGRWPVYRVADWQEVLVHLAAHEVRHLIQFVRRQPLSEVVCEEWAAYVLARYRTATGLDKPAAPVYAQAMAANPTQEAKAMAASTDNEGSQRYRVTAVSVGAAGLTERPAVYDTVAGRTVKVYRSNERALAEAHVARLNNEGSTAAREEATVATSTKQGAKAGRQKKYPDLNIADAKAQLEANAAGYNAYIKARKAGREAAEGSPEQAAALAEQEANREAYTAHQRAYNMPSLAKQRAKAREKREAAEAAAEAEAAEVAAQGGQEG